MPATPEQARFWQWFATHRERLRAAVESSDGDARETAMRELADAGEAAAPGVTLEITAAPRLIVSADGHPELVDDVKEFVASAPALSGWHVVAFRPREHLVADMEIAVADQRVTADDIWFRLLDGDDGFDLILHIRGLTEENAELRSLAAFLLAQHAAGERDMVTMLDSRVAEPLPAAPESAGLLPLPELADAFDRLKASHYPPPGALPVGTDSKWATVEGTRNGAPMLGILNFGLRALAGHPDYDRRITVAIPFHATNDDGYPAAKTEYLAVGELEERVADALQAGQQSVLVLSFMASGRRELVFHTADAEAALRRLHGLRAGGISHQLEPRVEPDTFWSLYRSLCQSADDDPGEDPDDDQ